LDPKTIVAAACRKHVLVPAFNIPYLPMLEPVAQAVEELGIWAMVEVAMPDVKRFEAKSFATVADMYRRLKWRARLSLHLDHVPVIDEDGNRLDWRALVTEGLDAGYQSVMIDGSRLPLDENIAVAREVTDMCHARGVPTEAELGAVLGHEAGPLPPYEELFRSGRGFTRSGDAERFVKESGVDWLSVAIGNVHGAIQGAAKDQRKVEARLNIEHLQKLADVTRIPLVLHGGSGISPAHLRDAAQHGIAKLNVGTEIRQAYEKAMKESGDVKRAQQAVRDATARLVREDYRIEGSAAKLG
jgi:ketose-bisphosphate aldolase